MLQIPPKILQKIRYFLTNDFTKGLMVVFLLAIFFSRSFFQSAILHTHDMEIHAARQAQFYLSLRNGDLPPSWAINTNEGFGMPVFQFTYLYPYTLGAVWFVLTKSIELSLNLVMVSSLVLAATGMYIFTYLQTKKIIPSVLCALLYLTLPYTLVNIFIRGALGEVAFMGWVPWLMILVTHDQYRTRWWYQLSWIGLWSVTILTHHLLIMILGPVMACWYLLRHMNDMRSKQWSQIFSIHLIAPTIVVLLMTSFFWLPMSMEKVFTKLPNNDSLKQYWRGFAPLTKLIYSTWTDSGLGLTSTDTEPTRMLGAASWLVIIFSFLLVACSFFDRKLAKKVARKAEIIFWLSVAILSIWLMTSSSDLLWKNIEFLQYQQFPWRFSWLAVVATCVLYALLEKSQRLEKAPSLILLIRIVRFVILATSLWALIWWAKPISTEATEDFFWFQYPHTGLLFQELLPTNFSTQINYKLDEQIVIRNHGNRTFATLKQSEPFNDGSSVIQEWTGHKMIYEVQTNSPAEVLQKTAYFPGWKAWVNDREVVINNQDTEFPGRVIVPVPAGKSQVRVEFTHDTWPKKWGMLLSGVGVLFGLVWLLIVMRKTEPVTS